MIITYIAWNHWFINWPLYTEGKERPKKETGHPVLVGVRFKKQENLYTRLVSSS